MTADEIRQLAALTQPDRLVEGKHACPVEGCGLSAEEHHALTSGTFALMLEVRQLRQQIAAAGDPSQDVPHNDGGTE